VLPGDRRRLRVIGLLVALDGVIEHMTPYPTPLDQVMEASHLSTCE